MLYYAHFHSHMNYCSLFFPLLPKKLLNKIATLQKKAIRALCNSSFRAHTDELFFKLDILPLKYLGITYGTCSLRGGPHLCMPLKSRLRPSFVRNLCRLIITSNCSQPAQISHERVGVYFSVGCTDVREVLHGDCGFHT